MPQALLVMDAQKGIVARRTDHAEAVLATMGRVIAEARRRSVPHEWIDNQ